MLRTSAPGLRSPDVTPSMHPPYIVAGVVTIVLIGAVVTDLRTRTIPDSLSLALVALAALASFRGWHDVSFSRLGMGLLAGLVIGAALFYLGVMGGGDAKLCAGLGAVCGWPGLLEVLFATAVAGGFLSFLAKRRGAETLAYAPAFAMGYAITVCIAWSLPPRTGLWSLITERGA